MATTKSKGSASDKTSDDEQSNPNDAGARPGAAGSGDSGPGTSRAADPDESKTTGTRTAARVVTTAQSDTPVESPDAALQDQPADGHPQSSTDNVAAAAGLRTFPGENYSALVDEDGNKVDADDVFEDDDPSKTYRTVKRSVFEEYLFHNTDSTGTRLLLRAGRRVPRGEAARIIESHKRTSDAQG